MLLEPSENSYQTLLLKQLKGVRNQSVSKRKRKLSDWIQMNQEDVSQTSDFKDDSITKQLFEKQTD